MKYNRRFNTQGVTSVFIFDFYQDASSANVLVTDKISGREKAEISEISRLAEQREEKIIAVNDNVSL
ncbi:MULTISPECIES: hypothetical protein [unclassified Escherichia]|uniref:hypothetical protein n=1 Tax=unclassified Escherichia TaxID=2608889 RepID=UPI0013EE571E|nr:MULTISPECIES: hypothetical protein [unclassified Escherichia]